MTATASALPVLVLPGMDGTGTLVRLFVERLARHRAVVVATFPRDRALGYGDLTRLITERYVPDGPFVLLAESFSGPIAIEIAAREPNAAGLVLVSSFARHPLPRWLARPSRLIDVRRLPRWLIEGMLLGSDETPGVRDRLATAVANVSAEAMKARTVAALEVDRRDLLRHLTCPVLAIASARDLLLGRRGIAGILDARPRCRVETVRGPHMLLATRPVEVAAHVDRFCNHLQADRLAGRAP